MVNILMGVRNFPNFINVSNIPCFLNVAATIIGASPTKRKYLFQDIELQFTSLDFFHTRVSKPTLPLKVSKWTCIIFISLYIAPSITNCTIFNCVIVYKYLTWPGEKAGLGTFPQVNFYHYF